MEESRTSIEYMLNLLLHRIHEAIGWKELIASRAASCLTHCLVVQYYGCGTTYRTSHLSPTISHTFPVLKPPPKALSSTVSPVVKHSSRCNPESSRERKTGRNSQQIVSTMSFASLATTLHLFARSVTDNSKTSATVDS